MSIEVVRAGMLTTLQDRGRAGCALLGVGTAGPMDDVASRLANALVGNAADAVVLEITLIGPRLKFTEAATIALTGADHPDVPMWRPLDVAADTVIDFGTARHGARAYLAIAGGFAVDRVLGSASTDVNARLGGIDGRPLRDGDRLVIGAVGRSAAQSHPAWSLDPRPWFDADTATPIRLICGTHFDALDAGSRTALFDHVFRIAPDSNRVGFRLDGPRLALSAPIELVSEPLAAGTLQLPPGGQPIALMAEHPTIGGYPRIGHVAAVDIPLLAQRRPGDAVRFVEIDLDGAQTRYLERERELATLIQAIDERLTR
ncbi:MAG TPA: biotin-dependent carboxyltransferase family protein [Rhodanobacteraceae bacterium]|nr:biotin-dependent carboxyltransferase family protein [Rhodanobacteraceae bacterium]